MTWVLSCYVLLSTEPRVRDIIKENRKEVTAVREVAVEEERHEESLGDDG